MSVATPTPSSRRGVPVTTPRVISASVTDVRMTPRMESLNDPFTREALTLVIRAFGEPDGPAGASPTPDERAVYVISTLCEGALVVSWPLTGKHTGQAALVSKPCWLPRKSHRLGQWTLLWTVISVLLHLFTIGNSRCACPRWRRLCFPRKSQVCRGSRLKPNRPPDTALPQV